MSWQPGYHAGGFYRDSAPSAHQLRRDRAVARRFMVKHLAEVACIHTLSAHTAPVRQFALMGERRVELLGDPSGERIVELERAEVGFASHHASSTRQREFGSRGNLGNFWASAALKATFAACLRSDCSSAVRRLLGDFMYALFLEQQDGHLEWFCTAPDEERARVVARFSSKYGSSPVVVMKQSHGASTGVAAFRDGQPVPLKN